MKSLILVATTLLSLTSMAQVVESEIIENAAKSIRRSHWVQGYENVESSSYKVDEKYLAEYLAQPYYEERLNSEEIAEIEACIKNSICSAYNVLLSAEYWGGY